MKMIPIRVNPKPYNGQDQKKIAKFRSAVEDARRIEEYFNDFMKDKYEHVFIYDDIANDLHMTKKTVRDLLYRVDAGSNGITVVHLKNAPKG